MTYRTRSDSFEGSPSVYHIEAPALPWENTIEYDGSSWEKSMTDVVTPGYHKKIARGDIINNPCTLRSNTRNIYGGANGTYVDQTSTHYNVTGALTAKRLQDYGYAITGYAVAPTGDSNTVRRAKLSALNNIDVTPYAFGEDVLEIKETVKFLKRPLGSLFDASRLFYRSVKRHERLGLSHARALANAWTEHRFALMPLTRSVSDLYSSFCKKETKISPRRTARGFATDNSISTASPTSVVGSHTCVFSHSIELDVDYRAYILYEVSNPITGWRQTYGLRNKDIPKTLWQVVPLSFLVDRIVDISSAIGALTNLLDPSVKILAAGVVKKRSVTDKFRIESEQHTGWSVVNAAPGEMIENIEFEFSRRPWYPTISDIIPPVTPGNLVRDLTSTVDLMAIVTQRLT